MVLGYGASRLVCVFLVASRVSAVTTPSPPTIETTGVETTTVSADPMTGTTGEVEMPQVPLTEQVMDLNISVSDVPDVDPELTDVPEATKLQRNRVIRDVAYYIRAHKFRDFDRRYHKSANETTIGFYEDFPKPALRSPHWEVRKHCEASFVQCLNYLERKIQQTVFKREDDTVTVMREQKWSPKIHNEQIQTAQRDCQKALKEDDLTTVPFQGPIGKCIRGPSPRARARSWLRSECPGLIVSFARSRRLLSSSRRLARATVVSERFSNGKVFRTISES